MEHYDNGSDGLEDGSTQDAILSDSEESESVSEESTIDAIENREPAGNDKYSFLLTQHARWEELYCFAIYSALHKGWLVEYVPNMENLAENGALNKCIWESNKNL